MVTTVCCWLTNWPLETHNKIHISLVIIFLFLLFFLYLCVFVTAKMSLQMESKKEIKNTHSTESWKEEGKHKSSKMTTCAYCWPTSLSSSQLAYHCICRFIHKHLVCAHNRERLTKVDLMMIAVSPSFF